MDREARAPLVAAVTSPADVGCYLRRRDGRPWKPWKAWGERRALGRCLAATEDVGSLCDCPCGPGRLFPLWSRLGLRVIGVDASAVAVQAARSALDRGRGSGRVVRADVASLSAVLADRVDLVACIRFLYYFERDERIEVLRALAAASGRYVLVEYKTAETRRARRNARRGRGRDKHACTGAEIREELSAAGLEPLRLETIGSLSDRVFALSRKARAWYIDGCRGKRAQQG